jgi:hypothetical protein
MNRYGARAKKHWERWLPARYSQLEDPTEYFTRLGEEISDRVAELRDAIAGSDPPGEDFMAKVGRLNMARFDAEGQVLRELALLEPEEGQEEEDEDDDLPHGRGAQIVHIDSRRGIYSPFSGLPVEPEPGFHGGDPTLLLVYSGLFDDEYDYCSPRVRRRVPPIDELTTEKLAASISVPDALLFVVDLGNTYGWTYYAFAPVPQRE